MTGLAWWRRPRRVRLNLALQGGGAHGAFTWGVLDRLLEEEHIQMAAVSGTSAGAMNGVVMAHGLAQGGRSGAREALHRFWTELGSQTPFNWLTTGDGDSLRFTPVARWFMRLSQFVSPYDANPMGLNPLRDLLVQQIDFERLRQPGALPLFVAATQAKTGRLRVFDSSQLSVDAVLASACLPAIHHAVEIDGEPYWDGGYSANPAVFPLLQANRAVDTLLVLLSPLRHLGALRSTADIQRRAQDIAFDNTFLREMHMLAHVREMARQSLWMRGRFERRVLRARFHLVEDPDGLGGLAGETRLMAHRQFLERLRDAGRARAQAWLDESGATLGRSSSVDIEDVFG
jgi:NTE family protein